jgi:hypothetical protein
MSKEKIYPKGLRLFKPHIKAPDFVKGTLIITLNDLIKFCKENSKLLTEYNGEKQLKCQILENDKGMYFVVDTWKPDVLSKEDKKNIDNFNDVPDLNPDGSNLPF